MPPSTPIAQPPDGGPAAGATASARKTAGAAPRLLRYALFFAALVLSAWARWNETSELRMAIVWLPTGVAVAGLWLLGARACWVVALGTLALRVLLDYDWSVTVPAVLGSSAEALLGLWVLRGLGVDAGFARLRDALGLFAAAALAPLASVAFSGIARSIPGVWKGLAFYSGWDGWWRMNALGLLVVVPLVATWSRARHEAWRARDLGVAAALLAVLVLILASVMAFAAQGPMAMILLYLALPVTMLGAVRFGPLGAASTGALATLVISVGTAHGLGPFLSVPIEQRHVALQAFELTMIAAPLLFGALIAERESALASRLRSDAARDAFQQFLPDATFRVHRDGRILDVFLPAGVDPASNRDLYVGSSLEALASPDEARALRAAIGDLLDGVQRNPHEFRSREDGRTRVREARFVRFGRDEVLCLVRDITERKHSEQVLAWEAAVLERIATGRPTREVLRALCEGVERMTEGGLCAVMLLEGQRLYQAAAPSLPTDYVNAIEGFEIGPQAGSCGSAVFSGQTVVVRDLASSALWRDCAEVALAHGLRACWSVPIRAGASRAIGSLAVYYREPRAPAPAELALAERAAALAGVALERERREDLLASINRNVNEGLFRCGADHRLEYANTAFARMLGFDSAEDLVRSGTALRFGPPELDVQIARRLRERGAIDNEEVLFERRDGTSFWGLLRSIATRAADGSVQHYDGAVADVTARKQLEEQLRQAQKMEAVGRLAGGVAHDFNNLLTAIHGCAESLLEEVPAQGRAHEDAEEVLRAAKRAAALTGQLLAYSRQQVLSPRVVDLARVVGELGGMLRRLIGEDVQLSIEHGSADTFVRVDRGQIEQVVLNLALNARDALPQGGELRITTDAVDLDADFVRGRGDARPGAYVRLSVEDNGLGMDAATRLRAFDPFFTTKEQGRGTGLGLSTVYGIVRQSEGFIDLHSELGAGTKVSVFLPRVASEPAVPVPAAGSAARTACNGRILVTEDEPSVRQLVARTLRSAGYEVAEAGDGQQALELARGLQGRLDLLLTDLIMPRMGGAELAERLRALEPGLRVLFVSGYADHAPQLEAGGGEHSDVLHKPFTRAELLARVQQLVAAAPEAEAARAPGLASAGGAGP